MNIETVTAEQLSGVITAQRGHVQALAFARKGGAAMSALLHTIWVTKAEERKSPLSVFLFIENTYTDEEKARIPVPGTKKDDAGNKPYDRYSTQVNTGDGKKTVPGSWFTDTVRADSEFQNVEHLIACCDDVNTEGCPQSIKDMGTIARRDYKVLMQKAKSDMRTGFVRGCKLFLHAEEISQINPERIRVKMPFRVEKDDNNQPVLVMGGSTNIRVQDPTDEMEDLIYSVSEFLALDMAKLQGPMSAQTIKTLEATKARAPRGSNKDKGKGQQDIKMPTTLQPFLNLCNVISTSLDNGTEQGRNLESQVLAAFASKGENRKETIKTVGAVALAFDNMWSLIQSEYNQIMADEQRATNEKARLEREARKTGT